MNRNERLKPHWTSSRYCVLKALRKAIEELISRHIIPSAGPVSYDETVIDLGCGTMPYRPLFEPYFTQYIGVDLPENVEANLHFDSRLYKTPLPDNSAKVILSTQVLEHVPDPKSYLIEARRLVKAEGIMLLSTHGHWREHPDPHDYWRWTSEGLMTVLGDNGWEVIELVGILGFAPAALQLFQDALMHKIPFGLKQLFVILTQSSISILDCFYSPADRLKDPSVFVVTAKPKKEYK